MSGRKKTVEFVSNFATMKKGQQGKYDSLLARTLINKKVAKFVDDEDILAQELEEKRLKEQAKADAKAKKLREEEKKKGPKGIRVRKVEKKDDEKGSGDDLPDDVAGAIVDDDSPGGDDSKDDENPDENSDKGSEEKSE